MTQEIDIHITTYCVSISHYFYAVKIQDSVSL